MRIDILTLFPDNMDRMLHESILGRACRKGLLDLHCVQIRDYTENRQNQVDDYPYGGGFGCIMMAQPLKSCVEAVLARGEIPREKTCVIAMTPQGTPFRQETARRLQRDYDRLVLVCGHYEGMDERFLEACVDEELSLGDFVLTGGEIAAMAVCDSVCRLVPGVLSDPECYIGESHWDGLLEYPQYTRPEVWEGREVPEVLLSGDHEKIARWRRAQQLRRTCERRPDLFAAFRAENDEDRRLIEELRKQEGRPRITKELACRPAKEEDLPVILSIVDEARAFLKEKRIDPIPKKGTFCATCCAANVMWSCTAMRSQPFLRFPRRTSRSMTISATASGRPIWRPVSCTAARSGPAGPARACQTECCALPRNAAWKTDGAACAPTPIRRTGACCAC